MLTITNTEKKIRLTKQGITKTYPVGSLAYEVTDNGLTLFTDDNNSIYTENLNLVTINGTSVTKENVNELLDSLFKTGNVVGVTLPIETADVNGLEDTLDSKVEKETGKGLTDENYTTTEKNKLANLDNTKDIDKPLSTAQQAAINKAVSEIEIGSRNYLLNSSFSNSGTKWRQSGVTFNKEQSLNGNYSAKFSLTGLTSNRNAYVQQDVDLSILEVGKQYTYSFHVYTPQEREVDKGIEFGLVMARTSGSDWNMTNYKLESGKWLRITKTFVLRVDTISCFFRLQLPRNGTVYYSSPKLEKGNKVTDWTPAIEDSYKTNLPVNNLIDTSPLLFEQGALSAGVLGQPDAKTDSDLRLRSKYYTSVNPGSKYKIKAINPNLLIIIKSYDLDRNFISEPVLWTSNAEFSVCSSCVNLKFLIKKPNDSTITIDDLSLNAFYLTEV